MVYVTLNCINLTQFSVIQIIHLNVGLKCFFHLPEFLLLSLVFAYIYISQGSIETHLPCGGMYKMGHILNCSLIQRSSCCFLLLTPYASALDWLYTCSSACDASNNIIVLSIVIKTLCFSVNTVTHELVPLAQWNWAGTCSSTTARAIFSLKVIALKSRSQGHIFRYITVTW